MIIIGEKINGAIPSVAAAIAERNEAYIKDLALRQAEVSDYIDICASTATEIEEETMRWLIDLVQSVTEIPLSIDSPDPALLVRLMPMVQHPGLINSISLEGNKCDIILPELKEHPAWGVVALCCDKSGIAEAADIKIENAFALIEKAAAYGIDSSRIHIDPLVLAVSAVGNGALEFFEAIRSIKNRYQEVHVTAALSNVSFGMPARKLINMSFLNMAIEAGLDSVIADPLNKDILGTIYAADVILNRDRLCRNYNKAFRKGLIGAEKRQTDPGGRF